MTDGFQSFASRQDLERLLAEGQTESVNFEFKDSQALTRNKGDFEEMCRDVTAFANSGSGQVIYGIAEDKKAKKNFIDAGVVDPIITREWIDQKLASNVSPSMHGLQIAEFPISDNGRAFVLTIPATTNGPHQSPDHKYYRRSETNRPPMTDREIRDVMSRSTTPDLRVSLAFVGQKSITLEIRQGQPFSNPFPIVCTVSNSSPQPAFYVTIDILFESDIELFHADGFTNMGGRDGSPPMKMVRKTIVSPPDLPVFREQDADIHRGEFALRWPAGANFGEPIRRIQTVVRSPGFTRTEKWLFHLRGDLRLLRPDHPNHEDP